MSNLDTCYRKTSNSRLRHHPSLAISQIAWRPPTAGVAKDEGVEDDTDRPLMSVAVASEDSSLRILSFTSISIPRN